MTIEPQLDPLPDGVLDTLRQVSTSTVATQLYKRGFRQPQLSQLPFPTYASAVTITTRAAWHHVADLQVPIGCAGVAVYPGDVLVADRDGIIVVPRSLAAEIAEQGLEQEQLEAFVSKKIRAGEPLAGNYPSGEDVKAEYKASIAAGADHDHRSS